MKKIKRIAMATTNIYNNRPSNPTTALFKDTPWHLRPRRKMKRIAMATTNIYENLEDDDLDEYGDYTTPLKLDCAATSTFSGQQTGQQQL